MYKFLAVLALFNIYISAFSAIKLSDSTKISLLTCAPGSELYSLYGHSALRVKDDINHIDRVFNYGTFDFDTPNFYLKFADGNLNYMLASGQYKYFLRNYFYEKRSVWEQDLNLSKEERQELFDAIVENIKPENRFYRYDFFYDNCATRIRDIVFNHINGEIVYKDTTEQILTYRDYIHEYEANLPWIKDGLDIILGYKTDDDAYVNEQMFLPDYLMLYFGKAIVVMPNGESKSLVKEMRPLLRFEPEEDTNSILSPIIIFWILFIAGLVLLFLEITKRKKSFIIINRIVFFIIGIVGALIVFLWFFSRHSVTGDNFNMLWANPLYLLIALSPISLLKTKGMKWIITTALIAVLCIPITWFFIPQHIPNMVFPLSLFLFFRLAYMYRYLFR